MTEIPEKNEMTQLLDSMKAQEKAAKKALWHQRIRTVLTLVLVLAVQQCFARIGTEGEKRNRKNSC